MGFIESLGSGIMNKYDPNTREGQAGLFGASTIGNLANQIGGSGINQMNAIRTAYGMDEMRNEGMPNLFSQGARAAEAGRIQSDADAQRAYANQAYGKTAPEQDKLKSALQEMIRAMKEGNLTFRR